MMRKPDFVVGTDEDPYILRWWIIPRNRFFNIYLHKICRSDDPRALHDHPWWNASVILKGGYWEWVPIFPRWYLSDMKAGYAMHGRVWRKPGSIVFRRAKSPHRLELSEGEVWDAHLVPCWSLFFTGPRIREWGFICTESGWRHWKEFVKITSGGNEVGRGCTDDIP